MNTLKNFGVKVPEILLPADSHNLSSWAVIACDQYTQDRGYWQNVEQKAAGKPSTLNLILPEVYLNDADKSARIEKIHQTMKEYLSNGVFAKPLSGMIYLERTTGYGRVRKGLITAIDLETYEWKPYSKALIRATEATIVERIPPRMEIRRGAPLESPHIMLLVNDPNSLLVEGTGKALKSTGKSPVYDGALIDGAGSIKGWTVESDNELASVKGTLETLAKQNTQKDGSTFLFAVGDGNHSLATAKAVWDEFKTDYMSKNGCSSDSEIPVTIADHPARYALVEIVNIYDTGLTFEPIHRVLFNIKAPVLIDALQQKLGGTIRLFKSPEELEKTVKESKGSFGFVYTLDAADACCPTCAKTAYACLETDINDLAVSRLQPALDEIIASSEPKPQIDYIHGSEEVFRLGSKPGAVTILLPPIAKESFFTTISATGPLPRKSFSMGEASEKRFYLECRKLFD